MLFFFIQTALSLPVFSQNSETGAWYINGPVFDRDRAYAALGYMLTDRLGIHTGRLYEPNTGKQFKRAVTIVVAP